jgi:Asp-tRNA(Asn)/Glu-tRNA(Gln) amidotransferase C subunit
MPFEMVVEDALRMTRVHQRVNKVRSDKPTSTRDEIDCHSADL